jgi:hypothetical protein
MMQGRHNGILPESNFQKAMLSRNQPAKWPVTKFDVTSKIPNKRNAASSGHTDSYTPHPPPPNRFKAQTQTGKEMVTVSFQTFYFPVFRHLK